MGDIAEVKAVRSVFSDWGHIKMNATKSMLGHGLGAAAGVEAVATVCAIQRGEVHPTINHEVRVLFLLVFSFKEPDGAPCTAARGTSSPALV